MNTGDLSTLHYDFVFGIDHFERKCRFPVRHDHDIRRQPFINRYERIGTAFCRSMRPELADLAEVATALYLADRFSPRHHPDRSGDSLPLSRHISVRLMVRSPGLWLGHASETLKELLWYLCGDVWDLIFEPMSGGVAAQTQEYLLDFMPKKPAKVMLFSGGLDSFAGAAKQMEDADHFHVLVSGWTHSRMKVGQEDQSNLLLKGREGNGHRVAVRYGLEDKASEKLESSQRTRGIVHAVLGAITALQVETDTLHIYENGIGALNLPFDETQSGWQVSRAVHPQTVLLIERLIRQISGQHFRVRMPFFFQTKAESLSDSDVRRFAHGIPLTFSCDRFPNYYARKRQCGTCSSCILRRLSLESAGLAQYDPPEDYAFDVESVAEIPKRSAAFVLDKFDAQAERFSKAIQCENPWRELTRCSPELREAENSLIEAGIPQMTVHQKLIRLLNQHSTEWMKFSGRNALERFLNAA